MTAIASILHRVSGVFLFFCVGLILYVFEMSLSSEDKFYELTMMQEEPLIRFIIWISLSAFLYHLIAGVKHLLMDIGFFEELRSGFVVSFLTILVSLVLIIMLGARLW